MNRRFGCHLILTLIVIATFSSCSSEGRQDSSNRQAEGAKATAAPAQTANSPKPDQAAQSVRTDQTAAPVATSTVTPAISADHKVDSKTAPKIVIPVRKLNFGMQPKEKSIVRSIRVRNSGLSELKIESVEPS
jgi:hypothetical protein